MLDVGVMTYALPGDSVEAVAASARELGFRSVALCRRIPGVSLDEALDRPEELDRIREAFARVGVTLAAVAGQGGPAGNTNLIHPDPRERRRLIEHYERLIRALPRLGIPVIGTESGSFSTQNPWHCVPYNATPECFGELVSGVREVAQVAEETGVTFAIEPAHTSPLFSAERLEQLLELVASPGLGILMDPCNVFTTAEQVGRVTEVVEDLFQRVGDRIAFAHAKDVTVGANGEIELPRAGKGRMDYVTYVRLLRKHGYDGCIALEHLSAAEIPESKAYVERFLSA